MGKEVEVKVSETYLKEGEGHALKSSCKDETAFMVGFKKSAQCFIHQLTEKINKQIQHVSKPLKNEDVKPLEQGQKFEILGQIQGLKTALALLSRYEQKEEEEE